MWAGSHTTHRTQRPSSPASSSQRVTSWLSLIDTASPVPGVPMEHFPTLKRRHLFLPTHNGTGIWGITKTLASRLYLYVCLEMPSASIPDLGEKDEERDEPGLTVPPSPHLQLTQDRIFLCS